MLLVYENKTDGIAVEWKKTVHFPPHLHEAIEVVYVTNGNITDNPDFITFKTALIPMLLFLINKNSPLHLN